MSNTHDTMGFPRGLAFLHLFPQYKWHSPARIAGTEEALIALRDALNAAIETGSAEVSVFAHDGEGYRVEISRHRCTSELGAAPYVLQMVLDGMAQERETERNFRPGKVVDKEAVG